MHEFTYYTKDSIHTLMDSSCAFFLLLLFVLPKTMSAAYTIHLHIKFQGYSTILSRMENHYFLLLSQTHAKCVILFDGQNNTWNIFALHSNVFV